MKKCLINRFYELEKNFVNLSKWSCFKGDQYIKTG